MTGKEAVDSRTSHVLNRLSFGPRPGDIERVQDQGIEAYLQEQLYPERIPESAQLTRRLNDFASLKLDPATLYQRYGGRGPNGERLRQREAVGEAIGARMLRAIDSPRQLEEVLADFWFNHFSVFASKGYTGVWVWAYERDAIRPHTLGKFRDLVGATARHPAMLYYLDNWQNTAPGSPGVRGPFQGINENYARELMELHTLGVDGGYTQRDVEALARILTGWGVPRPNGPHMNPSGFYFDPERHDNSDKVFLGVTIPAGGIDEGEKALDMLAQHPSTARFISYKLAQYFVADNPPSPLVDQMAQTFQTTDGDLRAVLTTLLESDTFWSTDIYRRKFKTPYQYLISSVRAVGVTTPSNNQLLALSGMMEQLGMRLYNCPTPDGYPCTEDIWLNPDAMLRRINFATSLSQVAMANGQPIDPDALAATLGHAFSDHTQAVISQEPRNLQAALILGSPEMMYR